MKRYNATRKVWGAVLAAGSGNILEAYDFAVYAYFASTLATLFFPNADPVVSLMQVFAAYGVGFVARPLGSIVIGRFGTRHGRKPAMVLTTICMAVGSVGIGLIPTYAQIGAAAPILLVALRALQGFSAGGEWGTSATFLVEWSPQGRRGFFGSFQSASISSGALLASLVASMFTKYPGVAGEWSWRVAFVVGGLAIFLFSVLMRANAEETPEFVESKKTKVQTVNASRWLLALKAFGFTIFWTVLSYLVSAYMVTYTQREAGLTRDQALMASNIALLVQVVLIPFAGALSDRVGRKPVLLLSCLGTALLGYPILRTMSSGVSFEQVVLLQCCLSALFALYSGPGPATICEIFPAALRSTWMNVGYTFSVVIFGGFSPLASTWLISTTHMSASPAFLIVPAAILSGLTIYALAPETQRQPELQQ